MSKRHGFTLVELVVVVMAGTFLAANLMPLGARSRQSNRGLGSAGNLMQIGQGAGMYALDNAGRIPSYSLGMPDSGQAFNYDIGGGATFRVRNNLQAAVAQQTEILRRRTGRTDGEFEILGSDSTLPHRRYVHLVLMDYLDLGFPSGLAIDPNDANLLFWAADPLDYGNGSSVPYANGGAGFGYDDLGSWTIEQIRNRWAFGSSYASTVSSWQGDGFGETTYVPWSRTQNLFLTFGSGEVDLSSGREFREVRFPSAKVYFFEEFDREQTGTPYFAYDDARPDKLMFDGSVNNWKSGEALPSFNVAERGPSGKDEWRQVYLPFHRFPEPLGGLGDETRLSQRYRWTLGGLQGVDYATPLMSRNSAGR